MSSEREATIAPVTLAPQRGNLKYGTAHIRNNFFLQTDWINKTIPVAEWSVCLERGDLTVKNSGICPVELQKRSVKNSDICNNQEFKSRERVL